MNQNIIQGKNNSIELLRFLFMSILVSWHGVFKFFAHGHLVVEFFFILSGYFIYISYIKKHKGTLQYTIDKIKRTYLEYFIVCIYVFFIVTLKTFIHEGQIIQLDNIFKFITELTLLQNIGIFNGGFNTPLWYFSVLIWGGGGLYALLKLSSRLAINIILPLYALIFYTYIFSISDTIECWDKKFFYIPMLRGLADMSIGIITAVVSQKVIPKLHKLVLFDLISIISLILFLVIIYTEKTYDKYSIIFIPIFLLNCISEKGILYRLFNRKYFSKLGGITYEMYLLHLPILNILNHLFGTLKICNIVRYIIFLLIIMAVSQCLKIICRYINLKLYTND